MAFVSGSRFKIASAFDGTVLDVRRQSKSNGAIVLTWNWNAQSHQIWYTNQEALGFRLTACHVSNLKALDQVKDSTGVIIWKFHGATNQLWNAFPVADKPGLYLIRNVGSQRFLRNMGKGKQLECSIMSHNDPCLHWRITPA